MIKMILLVGLAVAALIIGGVIEVKVHPGELSQAPGRILSFVSSPRTQAQVRTTLTDLKRRGEQLVIRDEAKKTKLALLYVKEDAEALQQLLAEKSSDPTLILPRAELLASSMQRVRGQLNSASIDLVTSLKDDSRESLAAAQEALKHLQAQKSAFEAVQAKFSSATAAIAESIQTLIANSGDPAKKSEVAGSQDRSEEEPEAQAEINAVPINF